MRCVDLINGGLELLAGRGEILQELDLVIEVNDEGLVLIFTEDTIEEGAAGGELLVEDAALAEAGVHKEAEGKR